MSRHLHPPGALTTTFPTSTVRGQSGMLTFHGPSDGGKLRLALGSPIDATPSAGPDDQFLMGGNNRGKAKAGGKGVIVRAVEAIYDHVKQVF